MTNRSESNGMQPSRREFVQAGVGLSAAGLAALAPSTSCWPPKRRQLAKPAESLIKPGDTILFQGDSITDAGRKRDDRRRELAARARQRLRLARRGAAAGRSARRRT